MSAYAARRPVRSVAVIGNAPMSRSAERAQRIDSCDLVLRVNGFALDEHAPAAGKRADVVVFNRGVIASPWQFDRYRDRLYLLVEPGRLHWEPESIPAWWPPDLGFVTIPNREATIPLADALGLDVLGDGIWATTGTTAAWIARWVFPGAHLLLSGFSFVDQPHQSTWDHAYGDPVPVRAEHRIEAESNLIRRWMTTGHAELLR